MTEIGLAGSVFATRRSKARRSTSGDEPSGTVAWLSEPQAAAIAGDWRSLAAASAEANVFFHPGFLLPGIGHLDPAIQVAAIRDGERRLVGLAPVQPFRLGHIAPARRIWVHDYGPLGGPLVDPGALDDVAAALLAAAPGGLVLPRLSADGPFATAFCNTAERADRAVAVADLHARAVLDRDDAPAGARAILPTRRRKEFARQMRRLADLGAVTVETATDPDRVRARFEEFLVLEAAGWKGDRGTALACRAATAAFARDVVFNRSERGTVRIVSLRLGDHPVAIVVCFVAGATAFTWKIAHDEAFARFSPGAQVMLEAADSLFGNPAVTRIDSCASANHPMIDHLWPGRLRLATFIAGPAGRSLLHRAGLAAFRLESAARRAARALRDRRGPAGKPRETES